LVSTPWPPFYGASSPPVQNRNLIANSPYPFARVVPEIRGKSFVGACPSSIPLPDDIDAPVGTVWNASA
jgi:hypothetical protein